MLDISLRNDTMCLSMRLVEDRGLVEQARPGSSFGIAKYLYRVIAWIDYQRHSFKCEINVSFFDQSKNPIHEAGEIFHPILVCFKNGTFQVLPPTHCGAYSKLYLGVRYADVRAWGFLPYPESKHNPGTASEWDQCFADSETLTETGGVGEKVQIDFYHVWQKGLKGATSFVSNLAHLWRNGYDTITSLTSEQQKSLTASATNFENSN